MNESLDKRTKKEENNGITEFKPIIKEKLQGEEINSAIKKTKSNEIKEDEQSIENLQEINKTIDKESIKNTKQPQEVILEERNIKDKTRITTKKKKRKVKKIFKIFLILICIAILTLIGIIIYNKYQEQKELEEYQNNLYQDIIKHHNEYVITNKETNLYGLNGSDYEIVGKIGNNQELSLDEQEISYQTEYFKINSFEEEYYIYYKDVEVIESLSLTDSRYKRYIVFNKNIVTKDTTNFYNAEGTLVYSLPETFNLPIIVNKKDVYGVEFNNRLLYVKQEDVNEIKNNKNTEEKRSSKIMTLAYHRIYDPKTEKCDQVICHTEEQFDSHMKYLSEKNYLTLTTEELSNFIDGYIQIPLRSVVITIDDGTMVTRGIKILEKYELNASLFIVTIRFKESDYTGKFKSDYVELHSHSHDMHWAGECAGYGTQGGGILCLPEDRVLEDLKTSSEILGGSTVFCYPFYDYNTRAINLLKKAGYTMAFAGLLNTNGYTYVGTNKMLIPRATILSYTSFAEFKAYVTY